MDEQIINKIKGVRIDWDKEALWEELEPQLPSPRRRFPWRSVLMGIALLTMVYCGRQSIGKLYPSEEILLTNETANNQTNENSSVTNHTLVNEKKESLQPETQLGFSTKRKDDFSSKTDAEEGHLSSAAIISREGIKPFTSTSEMVENHFRTHHNSDTNNAAELNILKGTMAPSLSSGFTQENPPNTAVDNTEDVSPETLESEGSSRDLETIHAEHDQKLINDIPFKLPVLIRTTVSSLEEEQLDFVSRISLGHGKKKEVQTGVYIDLSAGVGTLNRSVVAAASDPIEGSMLLDNKAFEQTQFNRLMTLDIGYRMKTKLFFQSGLHYSEKHEQLNWQEAIAVDTVEFFNNKAYFSIDELGDTTFYSGRSERIETTERELRHWNKLKTYELPLAIGYSKCYNKFDIRVSTGLLLNISRQFKGRVIGIDKQVVDNPEIGLSNRLGLGYTAALGLGYQIIGKHQVFVNGAYRRSPTFKMLSGKQFYQSLNIQLGFRMFLNNR